MKQLPQAQSQKTQTQPQFQPQPQPMHIAKHTFRLVLVPNKVQVHRLNPIQFRPFTLADFRDPKTGAQADPNRTITLSNGKTTTVQELISEANRFEPQFNQMGYSLRQRGDISLQDTIQDRAKMTADVQRGIQRHLLFNPQKMMQRVDRSSVSQMHRQQVQQMTSSIAAFRRLPGMTLSAASQPKPLSKTYAWSDRWGDSDFAASLRANLQLNGDQTKLTATMDGGAGASLFGHNWDVISLNGSLSSPLPPQQAFRTNGVAADQQLHTTLTAKVIGIDLIDIDRTDPNNISLEDKQDTSIDEDLDIPFTIGPVPVDVKLGFQGSAGVQYGLYLTPLSAQAHVTPYVDTSAYAQCSVDLVIFSAGAGADLTLLKDNLEVYGALGIDMTQPNNPLFTYQAYALNNIDALSGKVYAKVSVDLWLWSDSWTWNIFNWTGFKYQGYLFNEQDTQPMFLAAGSKLLQVTVKEVSMTGDKKRFPLEAGNIDGAQHNGLVMIGPKHEAFTLGSSAPTISPNWQYSTVVDSSAPIEITIETERNGKPVQKNGQTTSIPNAPIAQAHLTYDLGSHTFTGTATSKSGLPAGQSGQQSAVDNHIYAGSTQVQGKAGQVLRVESDAGWMEFVIEEK
jgi:hypothetical protein